ncbi:hypothetical protein [Saccharicrinis aurantiacus]|uniref:hypothetical protein n=1 Tax=Saccharicrinis aurantiacus TaxID=1849719 RepID=UPI0009500C21|nr:hypothetical protein [Saccharicrinis aurantiacus]
MRKLSLIYILLILLIGICKGQEGQDLKYSLPENITKDSLVSDILENGSVQAYNDLSSFFFSNAYFEEILPYSLMMANKWKYPDAMLDVYVILLALNDCLFYRNVNVMDAMSRNMALEYLIRYNSTAKSSNKKADIYKFHVQKLIDDNK